MGLKVIGAGFGRTGTLSLYAALNQLGFPCYHMVEILETRKNKSHLDFWHDVANGSSGQQHNWERVFSKYSAAVDNPACCVWRELLSAYPGAKFILTIHPRGADTWYESTMATIYRVQSMWQLKVLQLTTPFGKKMSEMSRKLIWQRAHRGTMNDRAKAIAFYHQHLSEVKTAVPADQLLVYSVDQGWKPLCAFLGVPEPSSEFPNVNDRVAFRKNLKGISRAAYSILGIGCLVMMGLIYGAVCAVS